ncbi:MAG: hypothetical protein KC535_04070 [Nanoarchaeota archaeon]|nr:hypothetical protein [Nanoarchaeota archaeon]
MNKSLKNFLKVAAVSVPMFISTLGFSQDKKQQTGDYDNYYSFNDIVQTEFVKRGIEKPTRQDTLDVYYDILSVFEKNADKKGHYFPEGIGVQRINEDSAKVELLTGSYLRDLTNIDDLLSNPEYPWMVKKALAGDYETEAKLNETEAKLKENKNRFYKNLGFGYSANFRPVEGVDESGHKVSSNLLLSVPLFDNFSVELAATLNDNYSVQDLDREVLSSVTRSSGRTYEDVLYTGMNKTNSLLGSFGLGYTLFKNGHYPLTLYAGTNVVADSQSDFELQREEVFFNGEYIGQGTDPKEITVPEGTAQIKTQGINAGFRAGFLAPGVQLGGDVKFFPANPEYNMFSLGFMLTPGRFSSDYGLRSPVFKK